jgi:hypothetical protein
MFSPHVASHIICVMPDWLRPGELIGIEMTPPRIRRVNPSQLSRGEHIVFSANPLMPLSQSAFGKLRTVYDASVYYDFPGLLAFMGFGRQDPDKMYCSELGAAMLDAGKYPCPPEWRDGVSPWDMQRHFEATGNIVYRSYKKWWA